MGGTEETSVSQQGVIDFPSKPINEILQKANMIFEFEGRPGCLSGRHHLLHLLHLPS